MCTGAHRSDPTTFSMKPGKVGFTLHVAAVLWSSPASSGAFYSPCDKVTSGASLQPGLLCFLRQVLFKLLLGSAKFGEAALFLSILGVFNILFITCIPVILYFTKVEYWSSFDDIPWGNLCGFSVLLLSKCRSPRQNPRRQKQRWVNRTGQLKGHLQTHALKKKSILLFG